MKNLIINILSLILFVILLSGFVWLGIYIYHAVHYTKIEAEFEELEPFSTHMPVFFKGFKIGKITKVVPIDNYTSTRMHITLFPDHLKLPKNIKAQVRSYKDDFDYVEIVLPEVPSETMLKSGDVIKGKTSANWNALFQKQAESGTFDMIIGNIAEITTSVNNAVIQADGLLKDLRETVKMNQTNLQLTSRNLFDMSRNLTTTTLKLNNSVDQRTLDSTMNNLEQSSKNLNQMTRSLDCATRSLSDTMDNVNSITKNVNEITNGVNCTMKKRFGGFRLIFGKSEPCCKRCGD